VHRSVTAKHKDFNVEREGFNDLRCVTRPVRDNNLVIKASFA
jgi:hypothetical protein